MLNLWQRRRVAACRQRSLFLTGIFFIVGIQATWANTADSDRSAEILVQSPTPTSEIIPVTGVKANPTEKGVEIIIQTSKGEQLKITNSSIGNNFIADIPNAQLRLPNGDGFTFRSEKPIAGITEITVTNFDAKTIRVTVLGEKSLPVVELFDDNEGLIFGVASTTETATKYFSLLA